MKKNNNNNNTLEAPEEYWQLSDQERKEVLNKCGPDGFLNKLIPDHLFGAKINESCNIHDFMFIQSENQSDLKTADRIFLRNMNKEIEKKSKTVLGSFFRKVLAKVYYLTVRLYSSFHKK